MTPTEAGQRGAAATKQRHGLGVCPLCGQVMQTEFYQKNGQRGGEMTSRLHGPEFYSRIGRMGGRGNKRGQERSSLTQIAGNTGGES